MAMLSFPCGKSTHPPPDPQDSVKHLVTLHGNAAGDTKRAQKQNSCRRGWAVSITQVLLMASPLSGLFSAIKLRSSAGFHLGMCLMNLISSAMWTVYAVVGLLPRAVHHVHHSMTSV